MTLAPALVAEIEAKLGAALVGDYRFEAWDGLQIVVAPTFIRDQAGQATDVRGVADADEARRLVADENARLAAASDADDDDDDDDVDDDGDDDGDDGDEDDADEDDDDEDDDEDDDDSPPDPARVRAALALTERALRLAPDDDETQFTHAMLLLDADRAGEPGSVDALLALLPRFERADAPQHRHAHGQVRASALR